MSRLKFGCSLFGALLVGAVLGLALAVYWISLDNWSASAWRDRFEKSISEKGEVKLADLVEFEWDKIFVLRPYDLTLSMKIEIFGSDKDLWWTNDQRFWTVIYRRPMRSPFVIRMCYLDWFLHRRSGRWSSDTTARFELIMPYSTEYEGCNPNLKRCVLLKVR